MIRNLIRVSPPRSASAHQRLGAGDDIHRELSALYALTENSPHVFGSPLGPFVLRGATYHLPRFVYFGPEAANDSVRLAFHAGLDGTDGRSARALLHVVERLTLTPDLGQGLNLSFFPIVNPSGFEWGSRRNTQAADLATENWERSDAPEIALLRHDAHVRGYHGFVRIESAPVDGVTGIVHVPGATAGPETSLLIAAEAADLFPVRWSNDTTPPAHGPLTIADDFAERPFELILRFPQSWTPAVHREAVSQVVKRFIVRYRATLAFGLHL